MNSINRIIEVGPDDQEVLEKAHKDADKMDMLVLQMLLSKAFDRDYYYVNQLDIEKVEADRSIDKEIVSGTGSCELEDKSGNHRVQISYEVNADGSAAESTYDAVEVCVEPI